jgi:hypothetical protein
MRANLEALPYVGPITAELFLRDLRELYPQVKEVLDISDRALDAAQVRVAHSPGVERKWVDFFTRAFLCRADTIGCPFNPHLNENCGENERPKGLWS